MGSHLHDLNLNVKRIGCGAASKWISAFRGTQQQFIYFLNGPILSEIEWSSFCLKFNFKRILCRETDEQMSRSLN